ncbi:MAG: 2-oxoacid:acceptor oxidoreductase family protein [Acidimicrobiales bacterium]
MERELIMTGIGGQGVQLAAAVLARAAVLEGREAQVFGSYGGMMRGGATESTVVIADGPIDAPPTVAVTWSAVLMHHEHAPTVLARVHPNGVVFTNSSVVERPNVPAGCAVVEVPAGDLAVDVGAVMAASMVMMGAYAAATGLVRLNSLMAASRGSLPPYRAQHADLNDRALEAGFAAVPLDCATWTGTAGAA